MEENNVPELAPAQEEFNHDDHMIKVQEGLQQILASEDINEIKAIAQSLLEEEGKEAQAEAENDKKEEVEDMSLDDYTK